MARKAVLFSALDKSGVDGLWVTDGTAAGTHELTGVGGASTKPPFGLDALNFTVFKGAVLFDAADTLGNYGLWVTNGTADGTHELTPIGGANKGPPPPDLAGFPGLAPHDFTLFDDKVLFAGVDASSKVGLWVTDGTVAGTHELTGISGVFAGSEGLLVNDLAVLDGEALFDGKNASGKQGLWVSDGTAAGTHELTGIAGVNPLGTGLEPARMTVFNREALFNGRGAIGRFGFWVSDGTAAGTHELTGITGTDPSGLDPASFTVFKGEVLLSGLDAAGARGPWVTNGTAAGTHELTGIGGAYAGPGGLDPTGVGPDENGSDPFTVFSGKVLFNGRNASGNFGFWVTDGTAAGTHELTGIGGANPGGINPHDFTVFNSEVLFRGLDAKGNTGLWASDGTAAGTHELVGVSGAFTSPAGPGVDLGEMTVIPLPPPPPSGLVLAPSSDSGVKGDDITNVTKPTIAGEGEAGDTVTLRDGAKVIGTAKVAAGGAWSVTPASVLAAGVHSLTATESSAALGVSAASAALKLTIKVSAPAPSGLSFAVAADKGALGDTVIVAGRGEAGDTVTLFDGAKAIAAAKVAASGGWSVTTAKPLAIGAHSLSASEVDVAANKSASTPAQSLSFLAATPNRAVFVGTAGADNFTGGAGNDIFKFTAASLAATDLVKGGLGSDELVMTTAGAVRAGKVAGVETYLLANGGANSLGLADANFTGVAGASVWVAGGNAGNTVNASTVTGTRRVVAVGGAGKDVFTGGAGNDVFRFTAAALANTDLVTGQGGTDQLVMTTAGAVHAGGVKGVEVYYLANGGANSLTLANANFAGGVIGASITVVGGSGSNTLGEAGVAAADLAVLKGGAGADTLIAGRHATMKGNGGADRFELTAPGSAAIPDKNTIADFAHGVDRIGLSKAGFGLGVAPSAATLFRANATGAFTTAAQRFAYATATGGLFYDADGSGHTSASLPIASLTNHAALATSDLFFIA